MLLHAGALASRLWLVAALLRALSPMYDRTDWPGRPLSSEFFADRGRDCVGKIVRGPGDAVEEGRFDDQIVPIEVQLEDGTLELHRQDEGIRMDATIGAISGLQPMTEGGALSAANASQICDGASAVMLANADACRKFGLKPMAKVVAMSVIGSDPVIMLEGPIPATKKVLQKARMDLSDIDL